MTAYELMFHKALIDLQSRYKSGAFEYIRNKYPEFQARLNDLHEKLAEAWKQDDVMVFREALKRWYSLMRRALEGFGGV